MRLRPFRLVPVLAAVMLLLVPAFAVAQDAPSDTDIAVNTLLVFLGAILVLFMQAGFAMLEVGLSRMKNAGAVMGKILINLSISFLMFWAVGFAFAFGTGNDFIGSSGWFMDNGQPRFRLRVPRVQPDQLRGHVLLPGRVLRRLARDRLRRDARPHQVHRLHHLRHRVHRVHLPDGRALDVGWWLAAAGRLPGLRRLVDRPPAGRARGARRHARPRARASGSSGTASPCRSRVTPSR